MAFAEHRAKTLLDQLAPDVDPAGSLAARAETMARSLTTHGYASTTVETGTGVQVCQHHCPVAHVAAEFPEMCEAETRAFAELLGTHVQRLATIAHGDGVCTTHIPVPPAPSGRH
jgi:predicted ArsR family transcriptional regulator